MLVLLPHFPLAALLFCYVHSVSHMFPLSEASLVFVFSCSSGSLTVSLLSASLRVASCCSGAAPLGDDGPSYVLMFGRTSLCAPLLPTPLSLRKWSSKCTVGFSSIVFTTSYACIIFSKSAIHGGLYSSSCSFVWVNVAQTKLIY